jgi:hypothetical protein
MSQRRAGGGRCFLGGLLALSLLAAAGCGGRGSVSGKVRYKGELLPTGVIVFYGQAEKNSVVKGYIRDGAYNVEGVPAGPVKITVQTIDTKVAKSGAPSFGPKGKQGDMPNPLEGMQVNPPEAGDAPPPGKYVPIPARYSDPEKSGLVYTVSRGNQDIDLDLQP